MPNILGMFLRSRKSFHSFRNAAGRAHSVAQLSRAAINQRDKSDDMNLDAILQCGQPRFTMASKRIHIIEEPKLFYENLLVCNL